MGLSYEIHYKKGVENVTADALSRRHEHASYCNVISQVQPKWIEEVLSSYEGDTEVAQVLNTIRNGVAVVQDIEWNQGLLRYKGKVWIGKAGNMRQQFINIIHTSGLSGHSGIMATYQRLKSIFYWPAML